MSNSYLYLEATKIFTYSGLAFLFAMWWAPALIKLLRWLKFWKKSKRLVDTTGVDLVVTKQFYQENEEERLVPRAGGLLIWITTLLFAIIFWIVLKIEPENKTFQFFNFISRSETFIPIGTLFFASVLGFVDDMLATFDSGGNYHAGGLKLSQRIGGVTLLGFLIGMWFYLRVDFLKNITIPWYQFDEHKWLVVDLKQFSPAIDLTSISHWLYLPAGWLVVVVTIVVLLSLWGGSIIDGFDGLAVGVFIPLYLCFTGLAFYEKQYNIATFLMVMVGAMAAYMWYNIPPAKFYMGDTGSTGILVTIGVVAILLNKVYVLPIAGLIIYATVASDVIQIFSKKVFKKKVFLAAPLHHHLEAKGWLRHQVTMRYWLISIMTSVLGLALGILIG